MAAPRCWRRADARHGAGARRRTRRAPRTAARLTDAGAPAAGGGRRRRHRRPSLPRPGAGAASLARGWRVVLATDERAQTCLRQLSRRARIPLSAATKPGAGDPLGAAARPALRSARCRRGPALARLQRRRWWSASAAIRPSRRCWLAALRRRPAIVLHEQNAVMGRANRPSARRDTAALPRPRPRGCPQDCAPAITGDPCAPAIAALPPRPTTPPATNSACWCSAAARRARVQRHRAAAGDRLCPTLRARLEIVQQCRAGGSRRVRDGDTAAGVDAELAPFFGDVAGRAAAHRDRAGGRRHGERTGGDRAAGDPRAAAARARRQPDAQRRALAEAGGGWRVAQSELTPTKLAGNCAAVGDPPRYSPAARAPPPRPRGRGGAARRRGGRADGQGSAPQRALPLTVGTIHFVGIGGIGMSGIAEMLHNLGYSVQGSDVSPTARTCGGCATLGIPIAIGHDAENVGDAAVVVVSSAVRPDNPEVRAAARRHVPVDAPRRDAGGADAAPLRSIAVAGTHGKTTTTSMVAAVLEGPGSTRRRHQRRHHQRLRHQRAARRGRLDGGRGGRERRHSSEAASDDRGRHQHRPRAPRPLRHLRRREAAFDSFVQQHPLLRLRGLCASTIPSVQAIIPRLSTGASSPTAFSPQADVRAMSVEVGRPAGRPSIVEVSGPGAGAVRASSAASACRCWAATTCRTRCAAIAVANWRWSRRRRDPRRASPRFQRREAALHRRPASRRRHRDRRLRPPSGRDRGGAEGGAAGRCARRR